MNQSSLLLGERRWIPVNMNTLPLRHELKYFINER